MKFSCLLLLFLFVFPIFECEDDQKELHESVSSEQNLDLIISSNATRLVADWYSKKVISKKLVKLLATKDRIIDELNKKYQNVSEDHFKSIWINLTVQELASARQMVFTSIGCLHYILTSADILHNSGGLLKSSQIRLASLRAETVKEESRFAKIQSALKLKEDNNHNLGNGSFFSGLIKNVIKSADKLESDLSDHAFENALHNPKFNRARNVEAVIKVEGSESETVKEKDDQVNKTSIEISKSNENKKSHSSNNKVVKLIDSHDNTYVLAKSKDSTVPLEDDNFIKDLVYIISLGTTLGGVCQLLGLPSMFGQVTAGIILGPSTLSHLQSIVQLETLGQLGVYFILFSVGLEFSPPKVRPLLRVSIATSLAPMLAMIALCIVIGRWLTQATTNESAFIGACLSLSSTPLVVNLLSEDNKNESTGFSEYGRVLLAILILQDVYLALLMALMPTLAATNKMVDARTPDIIATYTVQILWISFILLCMLLVVFVLLQWIARPLCLLLRRIGGRELLLLFLISAGLCGMLITKRMGVSSELGCFLAGMVFSALPHQMLQEVEVIITPVRNLLALVFFASIGLHVFPRFLFYEFALISFFTFSTVACKFFASALLLHIFMPSSLNTSDLINGSVASSNDPSFRQNRSTNLRRYKWLVAAGLSQVSEFSFVLGSSARKLGLCSREVYLLILGITTLSLLFAPLPWQLLTWAAKGFPRPCQWFRPLIRGIFSTSSLWSHFYRIKCLLCCFAFNESRTEPDGSPLLKETSLTIDEDQSNFSSNQSTNNSQRTIYKTHAK